MHRSNVSKAIILTLLATLGIVLMNTCAKKTSVAHNPVEMMFYRGLFALALLTPWMVVKYGCSAFKTRRVKAHLYRGIVGNVGVGFVFWAYSLLPMADATALLFAAPLFVAMLSPMVLKERVDRYRWMAVAIGFGGILLISRPSGGLLANPASLVGIAAALCMALVDMALRSLGRTDPPVTTVFYFILFGVIISAPYALFFGHRPDMRTLPWMVGIGVFAAFQQVAKTTAFQYAEASLLAPYSFTSIVWAVLTGWLFWRHLPTVTAILGTAVVIGSNLFMLWRER